MGGNVVDEDGARGAAVVGARDGAEAFCAGGVPELSGPGELAMLPRMVWTVRRDEAGVV